MNTAKRLSLKIAFSAVICCGFAPSVSNALELTPSSFGRVLDRSPFGTNGGVGNDDLNTNPGLLYLGDNTNSDHVYQLGFMFDLDVDWSFVDEGTTFTLTFKIEEVLGGGWDAISLMHVPTFTLSEMDRSVIGGGDLVSNYDASGVEAGGTIIFDITDYIKNDIDNERAFSVFRLQQEVLFNDGNGVRDGFRLNSLATVSAIPEPSAVGLGLAGLVAVCVLMRRKR